MADNWLLDHCGVGENYDEGDERDDKGPFSVEEEYPVVGEDGVGFAFQVGLHLGEGVENVADKHGGG